ncbi:MAG: PDZ domain-containing protein [Candidatus Cloacimonetes bacterium]|nr:PDZ domain-containing protein [Candidatus Cloacimonadota bacterium]
MSILRMLLISALVIPLMLLSSCASNYAVDSPTGRAEVIINGVPKKDISDTIVNNMLSRGFTLQKLNDYQLIFGIKETDLGLMLLAGSHYDSVPEWRYTYNLVDFAGGIRILTNIWLVTNPGSAFEKITDVSTNSKSAQNMHTELNQLKTLLENSAVIKSRGKIGIMTQGNLITKVMPDSPAQLAGLKPGDVMVKINGNPIASNEYEISMQITGEPGSVVQLTVIRNEEELVFEITRGDP